MTFEEKKEKLLEKIKNVLESTSVDNSHYQYYYDNVNPEAIEKWELITDEFIRNSISAREIFWGLGDALLNYVAWEEKQY